MQRVRTLLHIDRAERLNLTGKGIGVGVLDSGVLLHEDLSGRINLFRNFTSKGGEKFLDETGHGTHVCGIIAGNGKASRGVYKGVAPGCHLCVGKILDQKGEGDVAMMIRGMEWLISIAEKQNIKVINISVSSLFFSKENEREAVFELFRQAFKRNILVVTAAGNSGPAGRSVSKLGDSPYVICVGCHEGGESNRFKTRCQDCSGRGPGTFVYRKPDVVAPGTDIVSCFGYNQYVKKSGTSMATPIVSGLLALAWESAPDMDAGEIKRKLMQSADDLRENYLMQGAGMVNAERFLR